MKQRFSSLDVKVIAHELSQSLVTLRLSNVYDLSSKILLLKFAKPDNKKQLIIDSGFRCHLTEFARATAAAPSAFVARLRKFLKTRRVTGVSQIGTDRIIEFQFSDGQYRLFLEFFASGNIILTDADLKILTLLRIVSEGEGQEPQKVGSQYSIENRQNYAGVPALTKERLRDALQLAVDKAVAADAAGKKAKKKAGDDLRKGLATTITELPPMLVDHVLQASEFDATMRPADVLQSNDLLDHLLRSLERARTIVDQITSSPTCTGYIMAKKKGDGQQQASDEQKEDASRSNLLYDDFHPFLPYKFQDNPAYKVLSFDGFNKTVDEFFSSLEGQKLESRLSEREAAAQRKLEATKQSHAKRIEGLQEAQTLNYRRAAAIEANVERVQEAMDAVNGLIDQGMDWVDIGKLVERERLRDNPVAQIIKLPLKLAENILTIYIDEEEEMEDEELAYETDSSQSDGGDGPSAPSDSSGDKSLEVDINLGLSPWSNAREYYGEKRTAAVKEQRTVQQSSIALKNAQLKIAEDLKRGLKQEKAVLQPIRRQMWFEKFIWFISSDGYLVLGGKDSQQNEMLYKRYLRKGDIYVHADLHGAASVIIKNNPSTPDAPVPPSTLSQAGNLSVCSSNAWDSKAGMGAWWVTADQVSKSAPTGEFLPAGSFMVRGKKNFLPPAQLLLGFGIMFKISEESKAKHVKHRLYDSQDTPPGDAQHFNTTEEAEKEDADGGDADSVDESDDEDGDNRRRENPLQAINTGDTDKSKADEEASQQTEPPTEDIASWKGSDDQAGAGPSEQEQVDEGPTDEADEEGADTEPLAAQSSTPSAQGPNAASQQKKPPAKRGQRGKAKKIAAKYKDQDEEDRAAIEALIGAAAGRQKAEAEAKAKEEKQALLAAQKERRRAQHERNKKQTAEHEEIRRMMHEEGVEMLEPDEAEKSTSLDALVGTPLPGDEILEAIPVCAPWTAMAKCKYKAKMQPGAVKKGKAVKEVLERWKIESSKKSAVDESARDAEKMWPREVELIKGLKPEEAINIVPVGKVRVMMAGGTSGGAGGSKGGNQKGGRGGRGPKRK